MDKRVFLFVALAFLLLVANAQLAVWLRGPQPKPAPVAAKEGAAEPAPEGAEEKVAEAARPEENPAEEPAAPEAAAAAAEAGQPQDPAAEPAPQAPVEPAWVTLGSLDPGSGYKMLVTLTNRGAAVERIELGAGYRDIERRNGYLGHLTLEETPEGLRIRTLGAGTPAAAAGLAIGDRITALGATKVASIGEYEKALLATRPGDALEISATRDGSRQTFSARLTRWPLAVVAPEGSDPLSLLATLSQLDGAKLADREARFIPSPDDETRWEEFLREVPPEIELPGVDLRSGRWELASVEQHEATFKKKVANSEIEVIKRYWLEANPTPASGFHLNMELRIVNLSEKPHHVAYRLDGPTGLPTEGWWYATRISREWFRANGVRDAAFGILTPSGEKFSVDRNEAILQGATEPSLDADVLYAGVDAQYFASALLPQSGGDPGVRYASVDAIRVGPVPQLSEKRKLTNISVRLDSPVATLKKGEVLGARFQLFAGPKHGDILEAYGLGDLLYFGWPIFGWVSRPLTAILHFFHDVLPINYGIAIVMLTVLVRLAMFPLSRQQNLMAQKMQALQPELKKIAEKYKNNMEERARAQQEFMRRHNYSPLAGCLPALVQLPIFIGLYRALSVDVQLRDAPLLWEGFPWATNLSAPDMLFYWGNWMPQFIQGWLGPYFNLLPIVTIGLFLWQQKMFMPPPTDEQSRMQAKVMQYMMVFMGVMFFRVASGLCLYFIVSTLWGLLERKLVMPRLVPAAAGAPAASAFATAPAGNGATSRSRRDRQRGRK